MLSAYKLCTLLFCLIFMHTIEADDVQKLRQKQKLALQEREKDLLEMQHELQRELHRVHVEQHKLEHPESDLEDRQDTRCRFSVARVDLVLFELNIPITKIVPEEVI